MHTSAFAGIPSRFAWKRTDFAEWTPLDSHFGWIALPQHRVKAGELTRKPSFWFVFYTLKSLNIHPHIPGKKWITVLTSATLCSKIDNFYFKFGHFTSKNSTTFASISASIILQFSVVFATNLAIITSNMAISTSNSTIFDPIFSQILLKSLHFPFQIRHFLLLMWPF